MKGYALARLDATPNTHDEVFQYMERIQGTLDPFSGKFLIHGGTTDVLEGEWSGGTVLIEFPSLQQARDWYESPAYQDIVRLRTDHLTGSVILVEGVEPDHDSAAMAAKLRAAAE